MVAYVESLAYGSEHKFSKTKVAAAELIKGLGVKGDAHAGYLVKHRSRVKADPNQPNLRQVHIIHSELFEELATQGFAVSSADLGENITTRGIDLLVMSRGTRLYIGDDAVVEITGLRNPCHQIETFMPGLLRAVLDRGPNNKLIRKAGVMAVVLQSGPVRLGDNIEISSPEGPHITLEPV